MHRLCEREHLPCLFPQTPLPVVEEPNRYSLFLHGGLSLEAAVLAEHLRRGGLAPPEDEVLQLHVAEPQGVVPAEAVRRLLGVETRSFSTVAELRDGLDESAARTVVLWPGHVAAAALASIAADPHALDRAEHIFLPSAALAEVPGAHRLFANHRNLEVLTCSSAPTGVSRPLSSALRRARESAPAGGHEVRRIASLEPLGRQRHSRAHLHGSRSPRRGAGEAARRFHRQDRGPQGLRVDLEAAFELAGGEGDR